MLGVDISAAGSPATPNHQVKMDFADLAAEVFVKRQPVVTQTGCPFTTTHAAGILEQKDAP